MHAAALTTSKNVVKDTLYVVTQLTLGSIQERFPVSKSSTDWKMSSTECKISYTEWKIS
jgi:hypothetical protein